MLEVMKEEFEKWHRFPVTDDMDIQTEVAWDNWQAAWDACNATIGAEIDCRLCVRYTTDTCGCMATAQCVGGNQFEPTALRQYWIGVDSIKPKPPIDWSRVEQAEALGVAVHVTPAINEECLHDWENGEDGNPERCSKCGLSFMRFIHSCCP